MVNTTSKFIDEEYQKDSERQLVLNGQVMQRGGMIDVDYAREKKFDPEYRGQIVNTPIFGTRQIANPDYIEPQTGPKPPPVIPQPTNPGGVLPGSAFTQPAQTPQAMQNARQFKFQSPGLFGNQKFMGADPFGYMQSPALPPAPTPGANLPPETGAPNDPFSRLFGGGK